MPPSDIAVGITGYSPLGAPVLKKPPFLIILEESGTGKARTQQRFISFDMPRAQDGFVQVKGIFCDQTEDDIVKNFADILTNSPKEFILEMMFPLHRIHSIRSLVFNAVKSSTMVGK